MLELHNVRIKLSTIVKLLNTSWSGVGPGLMHAATKGALQVGKPAGGLKIVRSSSFDKIAGSALPGGIGTLDEVFEILALIQLEWMGRCNGMKNFACQKAFQDLEMDALMSLWSGENYCEILVHDLCRCNGMKNFASHKAFRDLEMDVLMSIWSGENYCEILDHDLYRCAIVAAAAAFSITMVVLSYLCKVPSVGAF
uniref:Uncharacterized protein n=1 Tax=Quercus lobata TaxID=97700 RepID=A0A7N2R8H2_QUELO